MNKRQKTIARRKVKALKIKKNIKLCQNTEKYKPNKYEERTMYDSETEKTEKEMIKVDVGNSMEMPKSKKFNNSKKQL